MEDAVKEQTSAPKSSSSRLRYPLRSATKPKDEKPQASDLSNSSVSKRGRPASSVSKSMGVVDLSGKEKSAKPPRRLSIPTKSADRVPKSVGTITPISEARTKMSATYQSRMDTPGSDVSRSSNRRKFNVLTSASYWLSQIKLSQSAAKHSISLGFFKLALEAQCEPLQRMRDELKFYAREHNLLEMGESVRELFQNYNILEEFEQLQVSETYSQVPPEEGTRSSDDDVHSSSVTGARKLEPKCLNPDDAVQASTPVVMETAKKAGSAAQKNKLAGTKVKSSNKSNNANLKSVSENSAEHNSIQKKQPQKALIKNDANKEKVKTMKHGKKSSGEKDIVNNPSPPEEEEVLQENKENMDNEAASQIEEIGSSEVVA